MIVLPSTFYQYVVSIDLNISSYPMCKHLVHKPLIRCTRVFKVEWHHFVAEEALAGDECSVLLIYFIQLDLVVAKEGIHETQ